MDEKFARPRLFASRCLGFAACRWNGVTIPDKFIESLKPYVDFVTNCPESEIGLGVPRDPIRIVSQNRVQHLMQPATGRDITSQMTDFSNNLLDSLKDIDGFILKDRSPSCGISGVKVYPRMEPSSSIATDSGFFGREVLKRFSHLPVESEARLTNFRIREHFLARIFTIARFRQTERRMKDLVRFHSENKLLLMAYNQKEMAAMGKVTANHEQKSPEEVFSDYEKHLHNAFQRIARYLSNVNILMHALGYFKEKLSAAEKAFFLKILGDYRSQKIPLSVPCALLKSYVVRFNEKYLASQTFFDPYPASLVQITDSGKGRSL